MIHQNYICTYIQLVEGYPSLTFEFERVSLKHIQELTSTKHSDNIVTIHCAIHPLDFFWALLLNMILLGTQQLHAGLGIFLHSVTCEIPYCA